MNKPLLIVSTVAAFMFASCDNENTANPEPLGKVTIKGAIVSDLDADDEDDEPSMEKIPAGVSVYFVDDDSEALLATATTTDDGYSQEIEIGGPRTIKIIVGDFETEIKIEDGDDFKNVDAVYNQREEFFVNVVKGGTYIENIEIFVPEPIDF